MRNVTLILDDGSRFSGKSFGYEKPVAGEVVFNTAMTGYPESLTDPSYAGQLMTLTYPLVGNYGVPPFTIEPNGLAYAVCRQMKSAKRAGVLKTLVPGQFKYVNSGKQKVDNILNGIKWISKGGY